MGKTEQNSSLVNVGPFKWDVENDNIFITGNQMQQKRERSSKRFHDNSSECEPLPRRMCITSIARRNAYMLPILNLFNEMVISYRSGQPLISKTVIDDDMRLNDCEQILFLFKFWFPIEFEDAYDYHINRRHRSNRIQRFVCAYYEWSEREYIRCNIDPEFDEDEDEEHLDSLGTL